MAEAMQRPLSDAKVCFSTTLDSKKSVTFEKGMVLILYEFAVHDRTHIQYVSDNILKVLFSPGASGSIRARGDNIKMVAGVARIITTNATSIQDWCRDRVIWSGPLKRKCIVFPMFQPLVVPNWSDHPDYEPDLSEDHALPVDRARELLRDRNLLPQSSDVAPVQSAPVKDATCAQM